MDNFIKLIIEESFLSRKRQKRIQREDNTNNKIPNKKGEEKTDIEEIIDDKGNVSTLKTPLFKKNSTDRKTTDQVVKTGAGSMGNHGIFGTHTSLRYWAEADMSKALGYEETMGNDEDYETAKNYFKKELGLDDEEVEDRLKQIGYDKKLGSEKVRLVENPLKLIDDFIESVLPKKTKENDIIEKNSDGELNPIVKKQLKSLKDTMNTFNLTINDVSKYLTGDESGIKK
jgi:hypothetical protein